MSFGPPRFISPNAKDKQKSPPRSSAEVAAKFDANIRAFDPRRKVSPRNFLRRKLPVSISPPPGGNRGSPNETVFAFPEQQNQQQQRRKDPFSSKSSTRPSSGNGVFQSIASKSARESKRKMSPLARYYANQERRPTKIFGSSSNQHLDDIFGASNGMAQSGFSSRNNDQAEQIDENRPFYRHDEVSRDWIRIHAKMEETFLVEELIREQIEKLELEHMKAMMKFKNEFAV